VVDELLSAFEEVPVDRAIAEAGGRIRRRLGLSLPDSLIAATAVVRGMMLLTRNLRHFAEIPALTLYRASGT
jgi:predicted nucleic acid-binding protein